MPDSEHSPEQVRLLNKPWPYKVMLIMSIIGLVSYALTIAALYKKVPQFFVKAGVLTGTFLCLGTVAFFIILVVYDATGYRATNFTSTLERYLNRENPTTDNPEQERSESGHYPRLEKSYFNIYI